MHIEVIKTHALKHPLLCHTTVIIRDGGWGAGCANGKHGYVVKPTAKELEEMHNPKEYQGTFREDAVMYVRDSNSGIVYGLGDGCKVEMF